MTLVTATLRLCLCTVGARKVCNKHPRALLQVGTVGGTLVGLVFWERPGLQRRKREDVLLQPRPERERDEFTSIPQTLEGEGASLPSPSMARAPGTPSGRSAKFLDSPGARLGCHRGRLRQLEEAAVSGARN